MSCKVWDEITYLFPNFNGGTVEVWEWISNSIPHITMDVITYPLMGLKLIHVSERGYWNLSCDNLPKSWSSITLATIKQISYHIDCLLSWKALKAIRQSFKTYNKSVSMTTFLFPESIFHERSHMNHQVMSVLTMLWYFGDTQGTLNELLNIQSSSLWFWLTHIRAYISQCSLKKNWPLPCRDRIDPVQHSKYHGCWCPGS